MQDSIVKCEVLLMENWVHKFRKGRQNEPKTEGPHTFKMSEYAVSEMQMIMHQVMLQWAHLSTC